MTELPFDLAPEVRTTDIDEAASALGRVYVTAELVPNKTNSVGMHMNAAQLPLITAGYLGFGADVTVRANDVTAYYIDAPLSGSAVNRWRDGELVKTTTGSVAVFTPGTPCVLDWSGDCGQICLKVSEPQMRRQLEAMLNRPVRKRITFARQFDLSTTAAHDWYHLVSLLAREVGRTDGLLNHRLAAANLQLLLIQGLLQIQPHNYTEALAESEGAASANVAKRAIDLLHAHPETMWSTAQLARQTGVSARALQRAFERSDQPSPMAYLRRLRLHRVYTELAASSPDSVTVTMVAGRWGFVHLGRFAGQYQQLFGETPAETLRHRVADALPTQPQPPL
ncbi:AraC family transcriptional regulator [Mycobacterium sp. UM_CSW]|uniref:AraC family transcriptional regulator n=1 Tax=Mycobacterium sp. UM_CSW TaxID=1370119 RepID=UPI00042870CE|nr:AraC family transcriptional regulator [Mycobacterium sp. UM_CSW]